MGKVVLGVVCLDSLDVEMRPGLRHGLSDHAFPSKVLTNAWTRLIPNGRLPRPTCLKFTQLIALQLSARSSSTCGPLCELR